MSKILIIGGFLGVGKTSLILQMAKYLVENGSGKPETVVILENEIGEISIDDKTLSSGGFTVETIFSGCICCTMAGEMVYNVRKISEQMNPDWIILESTGVAYPQKIREKLESSIGIEGHICCVADGKRWKRLLIPLGTFIQEQLDGAEVVLVNKIDSVSTEELTEVDESIRSFNPQTRIFHVSASLGVSDDVWKAVFASKEEE
jgi:Putative GTPases (G3E family)